MTSLLKFTTKPSLHETFSNLCHLLVVFMRLFFVTWCLRTLKARLGGEIAYSDVNTHKGYSFNHRRSFGKRKEKNVYAPACTSTCTSWPHHVHRHVYRDTYCWSVVLSKRSHFTRHAYSGSPSFSLTLRKEESFFS